MTVVTKPLTAAEKKKEAEANSSPLVQVELEDDQQPQQAVDEPDLHLAYLSMAGRVRRLSRANHMCLALCLTIVTMLGLMAGMHVYRTMFIRRNFCGTYRIPLNHGIMPENTLVAANFQNPSEQDDAFKLNMFALFNHELPRLEEFFKEVNGFFKGQYNKQQESNSSTYEYKPVTFTHDDESSFYEAGFTSKQQIEAVLKCKRGFVYFPNYLHIPPPNANGYKAIPMYSSFSLWHNYGQLLRKSKGDKKANNMLVGSRY